MEELKISKQCFVNCDPDVKIRQEVMNHVLQNKGNFVKKYNYFKKITVTGFFVVFAFVGIYFGYQYTQPSLNQEISKTKTTINQFLALDDNQIF
ncbi:MAG: hypothetical protein WC872_01280 [Candidatus Absconditabacterales bacterium]